MPPSRVDDIRRNFHGYRDYWTRDWYRYHGSCWNPYWIPAYRWWYRPTWYDTWGWFGTGFFAGAIVRNALDPYPYYYGSNIVYRGDMVYVNGVPYVSASEYYRQAQVLADSTPVIVNASPQQVVVQDNGPILLAPDAVNQTVSKPVVSPDTKNEDWMPVGTFAFVNAEDDTKTEQIMQLATNKKGEIRGNYVDEATGEARQVSGAVDSKTQRVALRLAGDDKLVMECGLWNLTQDSVPILIHYDENDTEQHTMVRLTDPEAGTGESEPGLAP